MDNRFKRRFFTLSFQCAFITAGLLVCANGASADPLDEWTLQQIVTNNLAVDDVVYGNGIYVASGGLLDGGALLSSSDGLSWTVRAQAAGANPDRMYGLAFGNGRFVAVGHFGGTAVSTNGINWTFGRGSNIDFYDVAYGEGRFVGTGNNFISAAPGVFYSSDGVNWTQGVLSPSENNIGFPEIAYGADKFVSGNFVSPDGVVWFRNPTAPTTAGPISFSNGRFFKSGTGTNQISSDGVNWSARPTGITNLMRRVTYLSGLYLAPISSGIAISSDGTNWMARPIAALANASSSLATDGRHLVQVGTTYPTFLQPIPHVYRSAPLARLNMVHGNSPELHLSGIAGATYVVQWTSSLSTNSTNQWQVLTNTALANSSLWITNSSSDDQRFYRASIVP